MASAQNDRVTLVLGGARSGKSRLAESLGDAASDRVYIATAEVLDEEMRERIEKHRKRRGGSWQTFEAPLDLASAIITHAKQERFILVDCLTLWVTNLMLAGADIDQAFNQFVDALEKAAGVIVLVSNEVGQGIVPDNPMAREFRDHSGRLHQRVAAICGEVYFVTAGLPQRLK